MSLFAGGRPEGPEDGQEGSSDKSGDHKDGSVDRVKAVRESAKVMAKKESAHRATLINLKGGLARRDVS